jgi:hypothetical protein
MSGAACSSHDPTPEANGYCECIQNGEQVLFKTCDRAGDHDPPLAD